MDMNTYTNQISKDIPEDLKTERVTMFGNKVKDVDTKYNIKATRALGALHKELLKIKNNEFIKEYGNRKDYEKYLSGLLKTIANAYNKSKK